MGVVVVVVVVLGHVDSSFVHASRTDVRYCSSLAKRRDDDDDDDDDDVVNLIDDGDNTFHSISFGGRGGVSPVNFPGRNDSCRIMAMCLDF